MAEKFYQDLILKLRNTMPRPRNIEFVQIRHGGEGAANDIVNWCNDNDVDMVCMGTDVSRFQKQQSYVGSVCAGVLKKITIPVCVARYDKEWESVMTSTERRGTQAFVPSFPELPAAAGNI